MVSPLSPRSDSLLNSCVPTPSIDERIKHSPVSTNRHVSADATSFVRSGASSPFETDVGTDIGQENRPMASLGSPPRMGWSQTKLKSSTFQPFDIYDDLTQPPLPPSRLSSAKHESFRGSGSSVEPAAVPLPPSSPFKENVDDTLQWKLSRTPSRRGQEDDGSDCDARSVASEDTCFSAFSAVPNADTTLFATLGNRTPAGAGRSPRKTYLSDKTPESHVFTTPGTSRPRQRDVTSRPGSPTPRQSKHASKDGDTTTLLLDFTQLSGGPQKRGHSPTKSTTEPNLLSYINNQRMPSPSKHSNQHVPRTPNKRNTMLNLLDFDLPPQPTPRSIPTITVRELESLKSSYLSEISSLKASLSGREAEAASLKKAVGDAERRVGEAQEQVRSERSAREDAEATKAEWEKKGKEVQSLLAKVREECMTEEREKAELLGKLDEANRVREEAELRAEAAASKAAVATRQDGLNPSTANTTFDGRSSANSTSNADMEATVSTRVAAQLDEKMENLARELHAVYKRKHEAKVATLKKTYELRAEKRCHDLQAQIEDLTRQNDDLMAVKDNSLSLELASSARRRSTDKAGVTGGIGAAEAEKQTALLTERNATIAGLEHEMQSVRDECAHLLGEVERERVEKGELVAAVDEMLALQGEVGASSAVEDFRRSIGVGGGTPVNHHISNGAPGRTGSGLSRPAVSGLARPGFGAGGGGESRIGRSASGGASGAHGMAKSRMMSNIERMGSGYGSGR